MAIIPKPKFPNVPKMPGVPQVARSNLFPAAPAPIIGLGLALGKLWQSIFAQPQWGIYKANPQQAEEVDGVETVDVVAQRVAVVKPDSFGEFGYRAEWAIPDFPIEDGAFANYDKVVQPYEIMVRMIKGGTKEARKKFLDSIEEIAKSLDLFDIVTPERTYLNVNITRFEVTRRGPRGAYLLAEVDLYFREIRTVTASYSTTAVVTENARNPSARAVTNTGVVQAKTVAPSAAANLNIGAQ